MISPFLLDAHKFTHIIPLHGCNPSVDNLLSNSHPRPNWKLTLLSCGNKKNNKNPHPNFPRRGCPRVLHADLIYQKNNNGPLK